MLKKLGLYAVIVFLYACSDVDPVCGCSPVPDYLHDRLPDVADFESGFSSLTGKSFALVTKQDYYTLSLFDNGEARLYDVEMFTQIAVGSYEMVGNTIRLDNMETAHSQFLVLEQVNKEEEWFLACWFNDETLISIDAANDACPKHLLGASAEFQFQAAYIGNDAWVLDQLTD